MSYYTDETKEERHIECLEAEVERLRALNKRTYCAYCGFSVLLLEDPDAKERVLDHIKSCEYHPLGQENARLREALRLFLIAEHRADEYGIDSTECVEALIDATREAKALLAGTDSYWLTRHDAEVRESEWDLCCTDLCQDCAEGHGRFIVSAAGFMHYYPDTDTMRLCGASVLRVERGLREAIAIREGSDA